MTLECQGIGSGGSSLKRLAAACALIVVTAWSHTATAATGCADGTREGLTDESTFPHIAACGGRWTGDIGSESADALCGVGWKVCSPAENAIDRATVGAITYTQAQSFGGCYALNAAHDFGLCLPCDPSDGDRDDLAGMGTSCPDQYSATDTSCLADGRIDAQNGSDCEFIEGVTSGVVCCQQIPRAPMMSSLALLLTTSLMMLAGVAVAARRRQSRQ